MAVQREYLSPNEIAELLGVSPFTIRRYIKLGELRAVKLLGGFRVHRDDLQRFLKAHEVNPSEEELESDEAAAEPAAPIPAPPRETEHIHRPAHSSTRTAGRRKGRRPRAVERSSDQK
ncbi:MAG: helix-turn-helix domain-containing protein [Rudaea sp.]